MNHHVTGRAIAKARVGHVMDTSRNRIAHFFQTKFSSAVVALQAERKGNGPAEQTRIRRAVRVMTNLAAFDTNGWMLERKWPAFFGVALEAGFFASQR